MKTINISDEVHKVLKAYCLRTGLKLQAVSDRALLAWIRRASK